MAALKGYYYYDVTVFFMEVVASEGRLGFAAYLRRRSCIIVVSYYFVAVVSG